MQPSELTCMSTCEWNVKFAQKEKDNFEISGNGIILALTLYMVEICSNLFSDGRQMEMYCLQ